MTNSQLLFISLILASVAAGCGNPPPTLTQPTTPTRVWPEPPERPRIEYLYSISKPEELGISPSLPRSLWSALVGEEPPRGMVRPYGIHYSRDGMLSVTDPGARVVHQFHAKTGSYRQIKNAGKQALLSPIGVTMDDENLLYVSDSMLRRIFVFDPKGRLLAEIGGEDRFRRPTGMVVHPRLRRLYVVDTSGHCLQVLDLKGNFLFTIGQAGADNGELNYPTAVALDREGNLYVNDSMNFRIQVFDPDGRFLRQFGQHGDAMGELAHAKGIALDSEGHIYVADAIFDAVQIFNDQGELLLFFGEAGQGPGEFWIPTSIFIDPSDRIFVCDSYTQRVQVFQFLGGK